MGRAMDFIELEHVVSLLFILSKNEGAQLGSPRTQDTGVGAIPEVQQSWTHISGPDSWGGRKMIPARGLGRE